jgi:hypothetical protein
VVTAAVVTAAAVTAAVTAAAPAPSSVSMHLNAPRSASPIPGNSPNLARISATVITPAPPYLLFVCGA